MYLNHPCFININQTCVKIVEGVCVGGGVLFNIPVRKWCAIRRSSYINTYRTIHLKVYQTPKHSTLICKYSQTAFYNSEKEQSNLQGMSTYICVMSQRSAFFDDVRLWQKFACFLTSVFFFCWAICSGTQAAPKHFLYSDEKSWISSSKGENLS